MITFKRQEIDSFPLQTKSKTQSNSLSKLEDEKLKKDGFIKNFVVV